MSTLKCSNVQHASAASPAIVLASDGTATAQLSSLNGGALAGARNRIINGDMRISQRGTSFATLDPAADTYTLDRWAFKGAGTTGRATISQDTDVPNNTFTSTLKAVVTTADSSIASGDGAWITQNIEGFNARDLIGTTFTLSFWVKSPKTGIHCVSFGNASSNRSFVSEYTVNSANTWEQKSVTVAGGLITAGTWDWTNGKGLSVNFALIVGSTFQTTAGAWQTGNFFGTSNQVNVFDSLANSFLLGGVQLEAGSVATPFERRSYGQELALCQRYHQRLACSIGQTISNNTTTGAAVSLRTTMRAQPTMDSGASFAVSSGSAGAPIFYSGTGAGSDGNTIYVYNNSSNWSTGVAVSLTAGISSEL
jgi:hypothetical protein